MIFRHKIPKWFVFMILSVTVLASLGTNYYLSRHSVFHFSGERSLSDISDDSDKISALKWRSLFEKKLDAATADEITALEQEISSSIDELGSMHLDEDAFTKMDASYTVYRQTLANMFSLVSAGQFAAAISFDKSSVEPAYDDFSKAVHAAELNHDEVIERQNIITYAGSLASTLLSLSLIVFLFWGYERQKHKTETTETEKRVLQSSEKRLKESEGKVLMQSAEIEHRNRELSTLYNISSVIGRTIDRDTLFENVMNAITSLDIFPVQKRGGIFMVENNRLELAYHIGELSGEFLELHENLAVGDCLCGMAAESGEVVISCNSEDDSRHTIILHGDDPHGHVIIPLKTIDSIIGVLYLYLQPDFEVDDVLMQMLSTIGNQLGVALDNACHYEEVKIQSLHDPLTGLANRRLMSIELDRNIAAATRFKRPFSVMMIDIDFFKKYNDTLGHTAGDKLLMNLADIVLGELREVDLVVRYGGEEFLVILPETDTEEAVATAERIRMKVMNTDFYYDKNHPPRNITVSFGVSSFHDSVRSDTELISLADKALYEAKNSGRNKVKAAA